MTEIAQLQTESEKLAELKEKAANLITQQEAAVITTPEENDRGADLAKLLKTYLKKVEDDRKSITDPLNAVVKDINARYKPTTTALTAAISAIKVKLTDYAREVMKRQEEEQRRQREAEEAAALEHAEILAEAGRGEAADAFMDEVAEKTEAVENKAVSVSGSGNFGGSSHTATKLLWDVVDPDAVPAQFQSVDPHKVQAEIDRHKAQHKADGEAKGLKGKDLTNYINKRTAETVNIAGIKVTADVEVRIR